MGKMMVWALPVWGPSMQALRGQGLSDAHCRVHSAWNREGAQQLRSEAKKSLGGTKPLGSGGGLAGYGHMAMKRDTCFSK